jgi:hypothetical protein
VTVPAKKPVENTISTQTGKSFKVALKLH